MVVTIGGNTTKVLKKDKEIIVGQMVVFIRDNGNKIKFMVLANMNGATVENMKENGKKTQCKGKEYILGLMEENMKEIM